jgi:hypothetical protein
MRRALGLFIAAAAAVVPVASAPADIDAAFEKFWAASNPQEAAAATEGVVASGVEFAEAYRRLERGRAYRADVARGVVRLRHRLPQGEFWYSVEVPGNYDPARSYPVRVQLHGGVLGRADGIIRGTGSIGALAGTEEQFYILPVS